MHRFIIATALATTFLSGAFADTATSTNPLTDTGSWDFLKSDFVEDDVTVRDGTDLFAVDAPYRAHDAATVPIVISQTNPEAAIRSAMVIIDENPAPMAAEFQFGDDMLPVQFEARMRVNQYSNVRVLARTGDGLFMTGRFVKASGGCSAPATKDPGEALASMGLMRLKHFDDALPMSRQRRDAQIMIRHPNYSGMQRDQITQLFVTAHFIEKIEVWQGDDMLWSMVGGISVSENPVFRFEYSDNGAPALRIRAEDTEGNVFEETLAKQVQS